MDERYPDTATPTGPRYAVLGGTFDPPHLAHLVVAQEVHARLALDRVYFVPAGQPPHKLGQVISPAADRCAMVEHAIAGNPAFALSRVEVDRAGPSYTSETLALLRAAWPAGTAIALVLGWDMLLDLPHWRDPVAVVRQATQLAVTHRPGYEANAAQIAALAAGLPDLPRKLALVPVPQMAFSATDARARVAAGLPIRYLVPDAVAAYIAERGLYLTPAHDETAHQVDRLAEGEAEGEAAGP